jgi:hypothetical protein
MLGLGLETASAAVTGAQLILRLENHIGFHRSMAQRYHSLFAGMIADKTAGKAYDSKWTTALLEVFAEERLPMRALSAHIFNQTLDAFPMYD